LKTAIAGRKRVVPSSVYAKVRLALRLSPD
jgi:hypothetical protein